VARIIKLKHQPVCLVLSRQNLPTLDRSRDASAAGLRRGAYVLADAEDGKPAVILIGTYSEVALCIDAYEELKQNCIPARVVSFPSWELFEQQDQAYRDRISSGRCHGTPVRRARFCDRLGSLRRSDRRQGRHA
jgi:transketolase